MRFRPGPTAIAILLLAAPALAETAPAGGEWSRAAPLPDARTEVSVTTDGTRIFLLGGFAPAEGQRAAAPRAVFAYDPAADAWTHLTDLPAGVNHAGLAHLDGRLLVVGGFHEASFEPIDRLRIYDLGAGRWSEGAPLPTPRGALATAVVDGRIHAIGGVTRGNVDTGAHEVYDPATDSWSVRAPMPTPRNHHAAATVAGEIVVLAGRNPRGDRLTVNEIYDPVGDAWRAGAPVPTGRSGVAAAELDGWVYLFGGESFGPPRTFAEAERYDPQADRWQALPPMPTARHGLGAAAHADGIHVISGGPEAGFAFSDLHERLVPARAP